MKAAVILISLLMISQPALGQSLFGGDDKSDQNLETSEGRLWKREVSRLILDRAPRLALGRGTVVIRFRVSRFGRMYDLELEKYANNAQALAIASAMSSIKLPPPPESAGSDCCLLRQSFYFH